MAETLEWILDDSSSSSDTTYNISDGTIVHLLNYRGFGIPDFTWGVEGTPSTFGGRLQSYSFPPREITLDFLWKVTTESAALTRREQIYEMFKPFRAETILGVNDNNGAYLRLTRADSSVRQIEVQLNGALDMPYISDDPNNASGISSKFRVNLIAPDPFWIDPTAVTGTITGFSSGYEELEVDLSGATWFMYPTFEITGPFTTMSITGGYNSSSVELGALGAAETLTIVTDPRNRSIKDGNGTNRYDLITDHAKFGQYAMAPSWYWNLSTYGWYIYTTGGTAATEVQIEMHKAYIGA